MFVGLVLALSFGASEAAAGDRTIGKVVKLLERMLEKSRTDGQEDRDLYAKFKCYCDDNEDEKKLTIEELTKQIGFLESNIAELQASSGELSAECAQLQTDMTENEATRSEAESLRSKAKENFVAEEEDMTKAVEQMGIAIDVLAAIGSDAPAAASSMIKMKSTVKTALAASSVFMTPKQRSSVQTFVQQAGSTSRAGEVVGILKSMRETFEANLASARAAEKAQAETFAKFMKTKKDAYDTLKKMYDDKQDTLGTNDGDLASKKTQYDEAFQQKADAEEFLAKLEAMCSEKAEEYDERKMLRSNEEAAIAQCIAILNSDAAFETFGSVKATSTGATGFLQLGSVKRTSARELAQELLQKAAQVRKSVRLAAVAQMLKKGNPFTIVLKEIEKMKQLIGEEGKADSDQLDWCNTERESTHGDLDSKTSQIETLETEITDLDIAINDPTTGLKVQIKETQAQLETNQENQITETKARNEENTAYQENAANLHEAKSLLTKAVRVLKKYYAALEKRAEEGASFAQREEPAPPSTWEGDFKGQSPKGGDAVSMLEFILGETKKELDVANKDEEDAQKAYEGSMKTLKEEQAKLERSLVDLNQELTDKEKELATKRIELSDVQADKLAIEKYIESIKPGCDFITANFDTRESNRASEIAALENASKLLKDTPAYKAAKAEEK